MSVCVRHWLMLSLYRTSFSPTYVLPVKLTSQQACKFQVVCSCVTTDICMIRKVLQMYNVAWSMACC